MIRRPLIWILWGWILGEVLLAWSGVDMTAATPFDVVYESAAEYASIGPASSDIVRLDVTAEGRLVSISESGGRYRAVMTDCVIYLGGEGYETHDLLLREENIIGGLSLADAGPDWRIRVRGELSAFAAASNPGEFDTRQYYRTHGIDYRIRLVRAEAVSIPRFSVREALGALKRKLTQACREISSGGEEAGIFISVLLGDRSSLDDATYELYRAGGIAHLFAISGLHLSLLGNGLWRLLRRMKMPQSAAAVLADGALLAYVIMIDGSASARRAYIMLTVQMAAPLLGRTYDMLSALGLAGILLLAEQPLYAFDGGFRLSFGAAAAIGIVFPVVEEWIGRQRKTDADSYPVKFFRPVSRSLLFGLVIQLTTLPIVAEQYYEITPYGLLINLAAIPMMSYALLSVLAGAVTALFWNPGGVFLAGTAHYIFSAFTEICETAAGLPQARLVTGCPAQWQTLLYYAIFISLILYMNQSNRERRGARRSRVPQTPAPGVVSPPAGRKLASLISDILPQSFLFSSGTTPGVMKPNRYRRFLPLIFLLLPLTLLPIRDRSMRITSLYVGQGDGIVLELPDGTACIIDCGSSDLQNVGDRVMLQYLKYRGISHVRLVIATHEDSDHINGLHQVIADPAIRTDMVAVSRAGMQQDTDGGSSGAEHFAALMSAAEEAGTEVYELDAGDRIQAGEVTMTVLWPQSSGHDQTGLPGDSDNDLSVVIHLQYGSFDALFTGDAGEAVEAALSGGLPDVDYLKVGHHGSRFSTSWQFLTEIRPETAVISCGRDNPYGHPAQDTLFRLEDISADIYITADSGAVTVETSGDADEYEVSTYLPLKNARTQEEAPFY